MIFNTFQITQYTSVDISLIRSYIIKNTEDGWIFQ